MVYTVKLNTETLYSGTDLTYAKWRFQLSSQFNKNFTLTLRDNKQLLMMHGSDGLVMNKLDGGN